MSALNTKLYVWRCSSNAHKTVLVTGPHWAGNRYVYVVEKEFPESKTRAPSSQEFYATKKGAETAALEWLRGRENVRSQKRALKQKTKKASTIKKSPGGQEHELE